MKSESEVNIYDLVYKKLLELNIKEINVSDFYQLVGNIKIPKEEIVLVLQERLLKVGLTASQVDRICNNLSLKLRWTKRDVRDIENHLREEGLILRKGYNSIVINKET